MPSLRLRPILHPPRLCPETMPPDIIKYFYEEPALLEPLTPNRDPDARRQSGRSAEAGATPSRESIEAFLSTPDYYRGYLAGTNRAEKCVGLTALRDAATFVDPLLQALGADRWGRSTADGRVETLTEADARDVLAEPGDTGVLVTSNAELDKECIARVIGSERRYALPELRDLLGAARVAFFPEPAHDGSDWSVFSAAPMREKLTDAFKQNPAAHVRRFVLPYQKARSESKFYFETWQLKEPSLPDYIEEV